MTTDRPQGCGPHDDRDGAPRTDRVREGTIPVLVVLSAPWAGPSRPAPTLLRELGRRWGESMHVLLVEDPSDELLDEWSVDVLPTWLRFEPLSGDPFGSGGSGGTGQSDGAGGSGSTGATDPDDGGEARDEPVLDALQGTDLRGAEIMLSGPWRLTKRLTGAQPKHVIETEFGPGAHCTSE